jgi:hypothetical protein
LITACRARTSPSARAAARPSVRGSDGTLGVVYWRPFWPAPQKHAPRPRPTPSAGTTTRGPVPPDQERAGGAGKRATRSLRPRGGPRAGRWGSSGACAWPGRSHRSVPARSGEGSAAIAALAGGSGAPQPCVRRAALWLGRSEAPEALEPSPHRPQGPDSRHPGARRRRLGVHGGAGRSELLARARRRPARGRGDGRLGAGAERERGQHRAARCGPEARRRLGAGRCRWRTGKRRSIAGSSRCSPEAPTRTPGSGRRWPTLGSLEDPRAVPVLIGLAADPGTEVRLSRAAGPGPAGGHPGGGGGQARPPRDSSGEVRLAAVQLLASVEDPAPWRRSPGRWETPLRRSGPLPRRRWGSSRT